MKISPVAFVEKLAPALVAGGYIGRDENISVLLFTLDYLKAIESLLVDFKTVKPEYHCPVGRSDFYLIGKSIYL